MKLILRKYYKKYFKRSINIQNTWIEEPLKFEKLIDFLNWFDSTESIQETHKKAELDWKKRLSNFDEYKEVNKDACLEIGFGGGRLIVPASKNFKIVYGVDIHKAFNKTREYLSYEKIENYKLLKKNELKNLKNESIDFIYSFIVFQHFDSFDEVNFYIKEIKRLLKPDGYCHIFFGKSKSKNVKVIHPKDFKKRECSLFIKPKFFRDYLRKQFKIIAYEDLMPKRLNELLSEMNESGQARVLFKNNVETNYSCCLFF